MDSNGEFKCPPVRDIFIDVPRNTPPLEMIPGFSDRQIDVLTRTRGLMGRLATGNFEPAPGASGMKPFYIPVSLNLDGDPIVEDLTMADIDPRLMILDPLYQLSLDLMSRVDTSQKGKYVNDPKWKAAKGLVALQEDLADMFEGRVNWEGPYSREHMHGLNYIVQAPRVGDGRIQIFKNIARDSIWIESQERNPREKFPLSASSLSQDSHIRIEKGYGNLTMDIQLEDVHWVVAGDGKVIERGRKHDNFTHEVFGEGRHHIVLARIDNKDVEPFQADILTKCGAGVLVGLDETDIDSMPSITTATIQDNSLRKEGYPV